MNNIRICAYCGAEMDAADRFCPGCGKAVQSENMIKCEKCGHMNDAGSRFCMACGEPLGAFSDALSFEDDFGGMTENPYDALDDAAADAFDALDDMTDDDLFGVEEPEAPAPRVK